LLAAAALVEFARHYNETWLFARHGSRQPSCEPINDEIEHIRVASLDDALSVIRRIISVPTAISVSFLVMHAKSGFGRALLDECCPLRPPSRCSAASQDFSIMRGYRRPWAPARAPRCPRPSAPRAMMG
jgi:hypothetical protein